MTAASRSLATALWEARFASGLLPQSYTTTRDTTSTWTARGRLGRVRSAAGAVKPAIAQHQDFCRRSGEDRGLCRRGSKWRTPYGLGSVSCGLSVMH